MLGRRGVGIRTKRRKEMRARKITRKRRYARTRINTNPQMLEETTTTRRRSVNASISKNTRIPTTTKSPTLRPKANQRKLMRRATEIRMRALETGTSMEEAKAGHHPKTRKSKT